MVMATKKQLKEYAANLEAIIYLNTPEEKLDNYSLIISENISITSKIDSSIHLLTVDYCNNYNKIAELHLKRRSFGSKKTII